MPPRIPSLKQIQKENIIKAVIREFRNHEPEKTPQQEMQEVISSWVRGFGFPIITVLVVLIIKIQFSQVFSNVQLFLFLFPVIFSSWLAGLYSGLLATLLGIFVVSYIAVPPFWSFAIHPIRNVVVLLLYGIEGIVVSYFIANLKNATTQAESIKLSFQLLLENTTDYGIIFFNKRGYITDANEGVYRLTGYKRGELQSKFISILYTQEDKEKNIPEKEFVKALRYGKSTDENQLQKKNGSRFFSSGFTTPLWTSNNQFYGFIKLFRDTTDVKRQEQEKEDFISIAAHELKNPVSSTALYLQLLQKYYQTHPDKDAQNYLKKASNQLQRLFDLITTLLDVSQIQKGSVILNKEQVDINQLVQEIIETIQSSEKQHRIIKKGTIKTSIMIDKRKIEEVLINLLNNAIKYSPEATRILVTLENRRKDMLIHVTDFGIGMSKDVARKIFERFYRGEQKQTQFTQGLGLGLYISSQIVKAHGGDMSVASTPGKGSTFSFRIPKT